MIAALAVLLAAGLSPAEAARPQPPSQRGPWVDVAAGPSFLHQTGVRGLSSGPLVRIGLGVALSDFAAGEVWLSGNVQSAPLSSPGDSALAGLGVGGRLRMLRLDPENRLTLWAHAGAGWEAATAGPSRSSPAGFAGAQILFQPFVSRFSVGLELDAVARRSAIGFALLPSLRAAL